MAREILKLKNAYSTQGRGYSHAAKAGNTLYIAGQIPKNADNEFIGLGNFEAQARQVYANIKNIVTEAGGSLENVVMMTTILVNPDDIDTCLKVRSEFFQDPYPPNTMFIAKRLPHPDVLIEVDAVAVLD